jgi:hypothetical protein
MLPQAVVPLSILLRDSTPAGKNGGALYATKSPPHRSPPQSQCRETPAMGNRVAPAPRCKSYRPDG